MKNRIKDLHAWGLKWAHTKYSLIAMFACAFADASFLPLPTPMFFIGLAVLNISNTYKLAFSATLGTVFGAILGYLIGYFAWIDADGGFSVIAQFFFHYVPGFSVEFYEQMRALYLRWDFWILLSAGYTPIPYQAFSISSGVFNLNFFMMLFATFSGQVIRFFILGFLVVKIGPRIKEIIARNMKAIAIASSLSMATLIILIKVI